MCQYMGLLEASACEFMDLLGYTYQGTQYNKIEKLILPNASWFGQVFNTHPRVSNFMDIVM